MSAARSQPKSIPLTCRGLSRPYCSQEMLPRSVGMFSLPATMRATRPEITKKSDATRMKPNAALSSCSIARGAAPGRAAAAVLLMRLPPCPVSDFGDLRRLALRRGPGQAVDEVDDVPDLLVAEGEVEAGRRHRRPLHAVLDALVEPRVRRRRDEGGVPQVPRARDDVLGVRAVPVRLLSVAAPASVQEDRFPAG